jgi:hypothetical protein
MKQSVCLDRRWFIVMPGNVGILYTTHGNNAAEAWANFEQADEVLGTGVDAAAARRMGYRARKCKISIDLETE